MGEVLPDGSIQGHDCDWQRDQARKRAERQQAEDEANVVAVWTIVREEGVTFCDDAHPVRLGHNPRHYDGEPTERTFAINDGRKGYLCPGGEEHLYPVWIVYDANDDRRANAGTFDSYPEAVACRDRLRAKQPVR